MSKHRYLTTDVKNKKIGAFVSAYPPVGTAEGSDLFDHAAQAFPRSGPRLGILAKPAQVHHEQTKLQHDQRVRIAVEAPQNPQHIAGDKTAETDHATLWALRSDQPGSQNGHEHGRPLQPIEVVHQDSLLLSCTVADATADDEFP
jgi:hypothetical protein